MDRFRFRVWDNANNRYVDTFSDAYNRIWRYYIDQNGDLIGVEEDNVDRVQDKDNFIVEQCTGLKDRHGKLIFEGDIISRSNGRKKTICFYQGGFGWWTEYEDFINFSGHPHLEEILQSHEIIGNIHEMEVGNE